MAISSRSSNLLGRRSILARIAAVLALIGCGIAIYLVVMNFTNDEDGSDRKGKGKNRSEQAQAERRAAIPVNYSFAGDSLGLPGF